MNRNAKANYRCGQTAVNAGAEFRSKSFTLNPFKGQACPTAFAAKAKNPMNKKKGPRTGRGGTK